MAVRFEEDRRARQGAWLFIGSLAIFFFSSMILYVIYVALRVGQLNPGDISESRLFKLPTSFITSTIILFGISGTLHYAVQEAKRDKTQNVLYLVIMAMILAVAFFAIQSEGMYVLIEQTTLGPSRQFSLYPFTFVLALLHALHVVGGVIALVSVIAMAAQHRYDHERHWGLQFCALYWHFLDIVWVFMMLCFVTTILILQRA